MHLNTRACVCGEHTFTIQDIKGRIETLSENGIKDPNFYGGNVSHFAPTSCPVCERDYQLWLQVAGQSWNVKTISARGWSPEPPVEGWDEESNTDMFSYMKKPELVEWLKANEVEYTPQWGEKRLRELIRAFVVVPEPKEDEIIE